MSDNVRVRLGTVLAIALLITCSLAIAITTHVARAQYNATYTFLRDFPGDVENGWSEEIQGIANGEGYWFFTQRDYLLKFECCHDLSIEVDRAEFGHPITYYPELAAYNHFGDLEYWQGFLFVPVEYLDEDYASHKRAIVAFNSSDLSLVDSVELTDAQRNLGWLAINHEQSLLYTSGDPYVTSLLRYNLDMGNLKTTRNLPQSLTFKDVFPLYEYDGSPLLRDFEAVQGGVFGPFGELYLVNGDSSSNIFDVRGGVHIFDSNGRLYRGPSPYPHSDIIDFEYEPGISVGEEPEGIDWWNLDESMIYVESPGINGQLHVIRLDNDVDTDDFTLKNYRVTYDFPFDDINSDGDRDSDHDEVYKYDTDPLIAPPTGKMTVTWNGNEGIAKLPDVTLYVTSYDQTSDVVGERPSRIRFKDEYTDWTEWEPYRSVWEWSLSGDEGLKTVYCQIENKAGLISYPISNDIYFTDAKCTNVFFNFNPNPAAAHGTVELSGIVLDYEGKPVTYIEPDPVPSIIVSYWSSNTGSWKQYTTLYRNTFGMFSTSMAVDSLEGSVVLFKVEYTASPDYLDSEAQGYLRLTSSEVRSASLIFFKLFPPWPMSGWQCTLTGTMIEPNTMKPVPPGSRVYVSYSTDDGSNWADVYPKLTDESTHSIGSDGKFTLDIKTEATSAWIPSTKYILFRVDDKSPATVPGKTAYLSLTDHRRDYYATLPFHLEKLYWELDHSNLPFEIHIYSLPGHDASFIDPASIAMNGSVRMQPNWLSFRDCSNDSRLDTVLDINGTVLSNFLRSQNVTVGNVTLLLTGRFMDNSMFAVEAVIKVRMPGDINIDGKVNILDLSIAAKAFTSRIGEPRWDPEADENEDGTINIIDITIIAQKFGTKYA